MHPSVTRHVRRVVLVVVILALGAATAFAISKPPSKATITVKADVKFKPNQYLQLDDRYSPGTITIASGGTITLKNTDRDPHSLSIVKRSQVPRTADQVNNCPVCGPFFAAHGLNPNGGKPQHIVVDVGKPGFDEPGDSQLVAPKGKPQQTVSFKVTAKRGTTLYFICIVHPWMQGKLIVK